MANIAEARDRIELELEQSGLPISSTGVANSINSGLSTCDGGSTVTFRYFKLASEMTSSPGSNDQGLLINMTMGHPFIAAVGVGTYLVPAIYYVGKEIKNQITAHNEKTSYAKIHKDMDAKLNFKNNNLHPDRVKTYTPEELAKRAKAAEVAAKEEAEKLEVNKILENYFREYNADYYLKQALAADHELTKKYKDVTILEDGNTHKKTLSFTLQKAQEEETLLRKVYNRAKSIITPIWEGLSNASFAYWIFWMSAGIFTGVFAAGIFGVTAGLAFGLPLGLGFLYPAIKVINYFRKKKKPGHIYDAESLSEASDVANTLMRRAAARQNADINNVVLNYELDRISPLASGPRSNKPAGFSDTETDVINASYHVGIKHYTTMGAKKSAALNFLIWAPATFVIIQYAAWILTDFLQVVVGISTVDPTGMAAAIAMLLTAVAYGASKAYDAYKGVEKNEKATKDATKNKTDDLADKTDVLVTQLKQKNKNIEDLANDIKKLEEQLGQAENKDEKSVGSRHLDEKIKNLRESSLVKPVKPETWWKKIKSNAFRMLDGGMTGIFFARLFAVPFSAIFMFFLVPVVFNPYAVGALLLVAGVTFAYMKYHQFKENQAKDAAKAKLLNGPENYLAAKAQNEEADHVLEVMNAKKASLEARLAAEQRSSQPSVSSNEQQSSIGNTNGIEPDPNFLKSYQMSPSVSDIGPLLTEGSDQNSPTPRSIDNGSVAPFSTKVSAKGFFANTQGDISIVSGNNDSAKTRLLSSEKSPRGSSNSFFPKNNVSDEENNSAKEKGQLSEASNNSDFSSGSSNSSSNSLSSLSF